MAGGGVKVLNGLLGVVIIVAFCFAMGAAFGACKAGEVVAYRLLSGGLR